jgi:selenocysteine-specific elongation factor
VRLHLGPREVLARVVLLDAEVLPPGEAGYVQFRLETPGVAAHRDRFVVRRYSPAQTLGGGFVLDARASKHRRRRPEVLDRLTRLQAEDTTRVVEALLGDAGTQGPGAPDLAHALGRSVSDVEARLQVLRDTGSCTAFEHAGRLRDIATEPWEALSAEIVTALQAFHAAHPLQPGIARELLRRQIGERHDPDVYAAAVETLSSSGPVRADAGRVRLAAHQVELSADQERLRQTVASAVRDGAAQPPDESQLAEKIDSRSEETAAVVAVMLERRELVRLGDNLLFDPHVLEQIRTRLVEFLVEHGQIEVSTFRELVHTTRKYALPLLNFFDSQGLTRRDESVRRLVPGAVDTSAASAGD